MIVVLQRVRSAAVDVQGRRVAAIDAGLCLLTCAMSDDTPEDIAWLAAKIATLRVFADAGGATNLDVGQVGGAVLVVPQFTLAADWRKGRRPSFAGAAPPDAGRALVAAFAGALEARGCRVQLGAFGEEMQVSLSNEGPFTLVLDSRVRPGAAGSSAP